MISITILCVIMIISFLIQYGDKCLINRNFTLSIPVVNKFIRVNTVDILWIIMSIIVILFGGLRYGVGTDFFGYVDWFNKICNDRWTYVFNTSNATYMEKGYVLLNVLISFFTTNYVYLMITTSLIITILFMYRIKKDSLFVPLSIYIFFTYYLLTFNLIRQGIAMSFVFLALGFARDNKCVKCSVLIFIAALFHKTAIIFLPIYFLMKIKYKYWHYIVLAVLSLLLIIFKSQIEYFILKNFYSVYLLDEYKDVAIGGTFSKVQFVLSSIYVILCVKYYNAMLEKNKGNIVYINLSVFILILHTFFFWIPFWYRLNGYFDCLYALIIPEIISCEKNKTIRRIYYAVIGGILLFFFIIPPLFFGVSGILSFY